MKKLLLIALLFSIIETHAQSTLMQNFQTPPNSAKPRVWWHWMNGNISKDGIQKDLDWMSEVGIGGFQNFDANLFTPVVVPKKLVFMTADWKNAFKFTAELANKKGLEMAIAGSPGWSVTGGPWVAPKDGMKKYVWTEALVKGGKKQTIQMPKLPDVIGKIQSSETHAGGVLGGFIGTAPHYSADAKVIAYKLPDTEKHILDLKPKISKSGGDFDNNLMLDHDISKTYFLPPNEVGQDMWVQYEFDTPQTFKAFVLGMGEAGEMAEFNGGPTNRSLKVSDDGINFRTVAKITDSTLPLITTAIPATTAKYWRICFETLPGVLSPIMAMMGMVETPKPAGTNISEFALFNTSRIDQAEDKSGFSPWKESYELAKPNAADDAIIINNVVDLTGKMKADGSLVWDVPAGNWIVVRLGYSLTGRQNHPASPEATGLEVDKLDKNAVKSYINTYLDMYKDATGGLMGAKGLQYMILDSYEAGHMNWTKNMPEEFLKRRGYDLTPWIPVLTGRVVKSLTASESFLWDFRKTIGEMIAENHYDVIGEELHKRGMKRYTESHENGRMYLADGMDVKRNADVPMAAMWTPGSLAGGNDEEPRSEGDIREAASVANIYGQNILAAESMTSIQNAFSWTPEKLKRTADLEMASGLNRFVIHTSVHQPLDDKKPGFSLGPFGQYFTRHETWAGAGAKAWMEYLGRSSYMLQQGKNVADILYLYGENTNITWVCREKLPTIPAGYEFDFVNSSALINAISAKDGKLVAKSGNTYEVLVLDESTKYMTLSLLKKIQILANAGIKIFGTKPERSPSLSDNEAEFKKLADAIWTKINVFAINKLDAKNMAVAPDVIVKKADNKLLFRHRKTADGTDIYWINNRGANSTYAEISFRIEGKLPEIWNAETGKTECASYSDEMRRTIVMENLKPWDAIFIVFKEKAASAGTIGLASPPELIKNFKNGWKLEYGKANKVLDSLSNLSENSDVDLKYFSGTITYSNTINLDKINDKTHYSLELGKVKNVAEVFVNGINMGTVWKQPFDIDITKGLKNGENTIEIKVTNTWVNRLIGDAQPDVKQKTTFTTMPFYKADAKLPESGLLGPVRLMGN